MDFKEYYENHTLEYAKGAGMVHPDILDTFLGFIRARGVILDLGCGIGQDVDYFCKKSFRAIGIDESKNMIKYARAHHKGAFLVGDFLDISGEEALDAVWTASSVFTHLKKNGRKRVLNNLYRLLVDDGVLGVIARKKTKRRKGFYSYDKKDLVKEIESAGFSCKHSSFFLQRSTEWIFCVFTKNKNTKYQG